MVGTGKMSAGALACLLLFGPAAAARAAEDERDRAIERLQREMHDLEKEIEKLKEGRKQEAPTARTTYDEAKKPLAGIAEQVRIGGYGSIRFEENSADEEHATFTLRRFVLTTDAAVAPKLRFYLELEFERFRELELERTAVSEKGGLAVKQAIEGTADSEISLEQVWLEYALLDELRFRTGGVLVPLGRFNLRHDDDRWDLPRRPLVDRGVPVLPATAAWDELGAGFTGAVPLGATSAIDYHLYVVNGAILEPEVESEVATRRGDTGKLEVEAEFKPQTGTFGKDVKDDKAVTGRLAFSPALGHELAASFYHGRYTPDSLPSESINAFGLDGLTIWGPFEVEGEYVRTDFGDVDRVARAFARRVGDKSSESEPEGSKLETEIEFELARLADVRQGYWIEPRLRFRPAWLKRSIFGRPFEDPVLTAVIRWEQAWLEGLIREIDFSEGQVTALEKVDRRVDRITVGGSYRPVPLVAFQLAYEYTRVNRGGLDEVTNFIATEDDHAHAVLVGATFGF